MENQREQTLERDRFHPGIPTAVLIGAASLFYYGMQPAKAVPVEAPTEGKPVLVSLSNTAGKAVQKYGEEEMRQFLSDRGFRNLAGVRLHALRRMYLLWHYAPLFERVHIETGISREVLFAYFIIEATREGVESDLMAGTWNPGGVKYKGMTDSVEAHDDCTDSNGDPVPCAFEAPGSFEKAASVWSSVFNAERYADCKNLDIDKTCECLQKCGYHTAKNHRQRAKIARQYIAYVKNHLPDA